MNGSASVPGGWKGLAAASVVAISISNAALAQSRVPAPRSAGGAPVASAESAMEDKLMGAMAAREMDGLLDYYFKKHNVPAEKQAGVKSVAAWRELANPKISVARRKQLLQDGVRGVKTFLESTRDTEMLMTRAAQLIEYGMKNEINQIEYFGETPVRQSELNGSAEAVIQILDKTIAECEDTEVGRKYAADMNAGAAGAAQAWVGGYLNSFSSWSYAKDAFDKWAALTAKRVAALRAS